ncbi:type I-F CRISPR-associated protein Csy1 [Acinetobacter sp. 3657]|uniref:type I-F CRISPR-associated protein Csy1 n=1 Tax=Acinetobacter sp. 3657 TaxID=2817764 RepID=UPI0028564CD6|nr:CRISPR type I-F-associated protein Csy1 [Prolinoborus sp. 3657]
MNVDIVHASIENFLRQRIEKKIEVERKKLKDAFTAEHLSKIYSDHEIVSWMNYIADNASKVSLNVSHVAKLTHSSNKAINLIDSIPQKKYTYLLTTQTAMIKELDSAYTDASYAPVAEFLSFSVENTQKNLGQFLAESEIYFVKISSDVYVRKNWQTKIAEAYIAKKLTSHVLAKQVYFPIGRDQYHVISPVKSSALAHKVYNCITSSRSKDNSINLARKQNQQHDGIYIRFAKPAFLSVTKSNHQNASKLNGTRRGGLLFFQTLPPQWKTNFLPPKNLKQFLARCKTSTCIEIFKEVKNLLYILKKENLTINLNRRNILGEKIASIADEVIHQILFIEQSYTNGWSENFDIEPYLCAFLDPIQQMDISQVEHKHHVDEFTEQVARWISQNIGDKHESRHLKAIWFSYLQPIFKEFYEVLQVSE